MQFMIGILEKHLEFGKYYERSLTVAGNTHLFLGKRKSGEKALVAAINGDSDRKVFDAFDGKESVYEGYTVKVCPLTDKNAASLRSICGFTKPSTAGERAAFGFGDRLGNATPGHVRAARKFEIFPIFAQQSIREMSRTETTPAEVIDNATWGVFQENYKNGYGADADHLKTKEDLKKTCEAGFTMFTVDPSDHIAENADCMEKEELESSFDELFKSQKEKTALLDFYLNYSFAKLGITFSYSDIKREAVKYLRAVRHIKELYDYLVELKGSEPFDFEVSIDEISIPTTEKSHIFIITQLIENGVKPTSLAPRFPGEFQKGIDYRGDLKEFQESLKNHKIIAMKYGNYKLSIHSGSDKFSIFPIVGKVTHKKFHEKTAGTSYIEALRVIARKDPAFYRRIHAFALERFEEDRNSYHVTTDLSMIPELNYVPDEGLEELLDADDCRQLIHITYGSVLKHRDETREYVFKNRLIGILDKHEEEYYGALEKHFDKHLQGFGLTPKS